jgi:hypothetical protein
MLKCVRPFYGSVLEFGAGGYWVVTHIALSRGHQRDHHSGVVIHGILYVMLKMNPLTFPQSLGSDDFCTL